MLKRAEHAANDVVALLSGSRRIKLALPGLQVEYAWLPPFAGADVTKPNRIEVVFSAHSGVAIAQGPQTYDIAVEPGAMYVVGLEPTTLLRVANYSDTLEMYPDPQLLHAAADWENIRHFELQPTLRGQRSVTFRRDAVVLGIAHALRRACMGQLALSDIESSSLGHLLTQRVLSLQYGLPPASARPRVSRLNGPLMDRVGNYIEDNLGRCITLEDLSALCRLSPFHFARCFKKTTGLAPHQYVLARRIELSKRLLMTTSLPVQEIAWSAGFENISHFRRQFAAQIGVLPGALRETTCELARWN
jgi:AraC family transcriptional regulator